MQCLAQHSAFDWHSWGPGSKSLEFPKIILQACQIWPAEQFLPTTIGRPNPTHTNICTYTSYLHIPIHLSIHISHIHTGTRKHTLIDTLISHTHINTYTLKYTHTHSHILKHTHIFIHIHSYIYIYIHTLIHTFMNTHTHTLTHTHTHTQPHKIGTNKVLDYHLNSASKLTCDTAFVSSFYPASVHLSNEDTGHDFSLGLPWLKWNKISVSSRESCFPIPNVNA